MISVVVWLWNDADTIAPAPVPAAQPPRPVPVPVPAPTPEIRVDMQARVPFHRRQELRAKRIRERQVMLRQQRAPAFRPPRLFLPAHVNVAQKMFARHIKEPHRFICIADNSEGLSSDVEYVKTPAAAAAVANLRSPEGPRFPSCYRRLWSFSEDARILGDRLLVLDIDLVVTRDIAPIIKRPEDFVGWRPFRDWGARRRFGGGIYLMKTGSRTAVWDDFRGASSISEARNSGFRGSDQAWISYKLADKDCCWSRESGIYSVRDLGPGFALPPDARIVQFNGHQKPWHYKQGWVADHWR